MHEYVIEGGYPISGTITASGNKNAALPCLAATLLTSEPVILKNIPEIQDTNVMIQILESLGAKVKKLSKNNWEITNAEIKSSELPKELTKKVRGSIVFAGPLLARTGKCEMMPPGGDVIGRRRVDTHFLALEQLGANIAVNGHFSFSANKLVGADIFLDEASVTATENAVMAASLSEGKTIIKNAASEPHIQDLCNMLNLMGAKITGIGSNILYIEGVKKLHGCEYTIGPDYIEIGSYIGMAAATKGKITIKRISGTPYVYYETGRTYNKEKQYNEPKRTCIGRLDSEQSTFMFPNDKFLRFFPRELLPIEKDNQMRSGCLHIGSFLVIRKIISDYRLDEMMARIIGKDAGLFLDLAAYSIVCRQRRVVY